MLIILSPAKTMTGFSDIKAPAKTIPLFFQEASDIALQMAQFPIEELRQILKLSPQLALEAYSRFQEFHSTESPGLQALLAYSGVVFKHLMAADLSSEDFLFAQDYLRIVSICYGLLRPLDLIKPYRMEYSVKLPELESGNMYAYWRDRQTQALIDAVNTNKGPLVNLASKDVQPSFDWKKIEESVRIVTPEFKVRRGGKLQTIVIYAKMARGEMSRFIIKNRLTNPEDLKLFSWEGYCYNERLSDDNNWLFTQE